MGLAARGFKGKSYPILICDYCGKEIKELEQGVATSQEHPMPDSYVQVHTYHKGKCDQRETYSDELSTYIPWLLWNHNWGKKHRGKNGFTITVGVPQPLAIDRAPELLTISEAARLVHVSRETIYKWIRTHKIEPVVTPGGRYRIPEEQLTLPIEE